MGATSGCNLVLQEGQPSSDWTCPCGRGYFDAVKKEFIKGAQIREGRTPRREQYLDHLQGCAECKFKAEDDGLITLCDSFFLPRNDIPLEVVKSYVSEQLGASVLVRAGTNTVGVTMATICLSKNSDFHSSRLVYLATTYTLMGGLRR
jgi:hypothetical protein